MVVTPSAWLMAEPLLFAGFLVMARILGLIIALPGTAQGSFPAPTRILFVMFLTVFCYSALGMPMVGVPATPFTLLAMAGREFILGTALGYFVRVLFAIADVSGTIGGMAMSLSMAGMVDPATGEQTTAVSNLLGLGALMFFVALDGHQEAVKGLIYSLQVFPIGQLVYVGLGLESLQALTKGLLTAGLQIAAPIVIVTTMINVGLGLMARAAPQVNIFAVGFSLLIVAGVVLLDTSAFALKETYENRIPTLAEDMNLLLEGPE
jgi:flagellar biosynthetic protein FliR